MRNLRASIDEIAARRGVRMTEELVNADLPAQSSKEIVETIEAVCDELGVRSMRMVSRAYHDSLFMARIAPIAMIFIPCRGGVSHRPDEFADAQDIARGVQVLADVIRQRMACGDTSAQRSSVSTLPPECACYPGLKNPPCMTATSMATSSQHGR